jgi:hypothetical protein
MDCSALNLFTVSVVLGTWDSVVGIVTGYRLEFESRWGQKFLLLYVVQTGSGAHPASYPMGTEGFFPGGKAARA